MTHNTTRRRFHMVRQILRIGHCHMSRTLAYQGSKDLRAVQELAGHAKPETTAVYTLIPDASIRAAMMHAAA